MKYVEPYPGIRLRAAGLSTRRKEAIDAISDVPFENAEAYRRGLDAAYERLRYRDGGKTRRERELTYYHKHRDANVAKQRTELQRRRLQMIEEFGGKCARCGFDDWRALQLDHIDGTELSPTHAHRKGDGLIRAVRRGDVPREALQLLCANCNWIKRYAANECPRTVLPAETAQ